MKKAIRTIGILLLTVLILSTNTVLSFAEEEAVDMGEVLTVRDEKHAPYVDRLQDRVYNSRVSYAAGDTVTVSGSEEIGYAYIAWHTLPGKVKVTWLDKNKAAVQSEERAVSQLNEFIPVPQAGVCGFTLTFSQACAVSEVTAYTPGALAWDVPLFEGPVQNPTIMLIMGYPGDELLCFGSLVPTLLQKGVPLQLVYLNRYNRARQEECLRALWQLGLRNAPIFLDTGGRRSLDGNALKSSWENNGEVSRNLLKVMESYKPAIIVTHGKTRPFPLTAEAEAVNALFTPLLKRMKNPSWLKKVYFSAEKGAKNATVYDGSASYDEVATLFWTEFTDLHTFHYTPYRDDTYILHYTSVGKDSGGDILEHVKYTPLSTPVPRPTATPEPTAEPTLEPTAEPTAEPTVEPTSAPTMAPTPAATATPAAVPAAPVVFSTPVPTPLPRLADTKTVLLPILLSLLAVAVLFLALIAVKKLLSTRLPVIVGILVPILAGIILSVGLYRAASINMVQEAVAEAFDEQLAEAAARTPAPTDTPAPTATPEPTAEPTAEPTPAPTAEPTVEPTPAPTATPDPDEGLYSDREVVEEDADKGHWVYKNSTLSIEITQYTGTLNKMEFPYYVADIHMRADEFRAGFGHEARSGTGKDSAMTIAKKYKAVMLITGDNLIHMDKDKKGVLIRDGWIYQNSKKGDLMLWHPETLSIELVPKDKITSAELIAEDGVENCISFGPILIQDGVRTPEKTLEKDWLFKTNPRVGVGMVEPGHFIVIVGGYRSDYPKANLGWDLNEFTDLMGSYGCQQAYNMDGGVSAALIFMGERLNRGGNKKDWSQLRTLPDGLLFGYSTKVGK